MTVVQPSVSTAGILRMRAFFLAIWCMPIASDPVTMAASASGTAATARAIANMTSWIRKGKVMRAPGVRASRTTLMTTISRQIPSEMIPSHFPISAVRFSSGVSTFSTWATSSAIRPNSVRGPVSVTTALPRP